MKLNIKYPKQDFYATIFDVDIKSISEYAKHYFEAFIVVFVIAFIYKEFDSGNTKNPVYK